MHPTSILAASTKSIGIIANIALLLFLSDAQSRLIFHTRTAYSAVRDWVFPRIPFILNCSNYGSLNRSPYRDKLAALSSALLFLYPAGRSIGDAKASVSPWLVKMLQFPIQSNLECSVNSLDSKFIVATFNLSKFLSGYLSGQILGPSFRQIGINFLAFFAISLPPCRSNCTYISLFLLTLRRHTNICEYFSHSCHNEQTWSGNIYKFGSKGQSIVVWVSDCINFRFLSQLDTCFRFWRLGH